MFNQFILTLGLSYPSPCEGETLPPYGPTPPSARTARKFYMLVFIFVSFPPSDQRQTTVHRSL